ncbi:hypothetical protein FB562_2394 [Homoserinimonas aerilata]|uniref:Uncharacterized protein n=1 Tax=Homoserinimonas aerilata TaxID=1162970 RepID=A0A542YA82_9MICO|nr:hypothetical protein [Homoserinimonas aerilata]TQL44985.1 hypothetical protein FB562_2394 [Homoserinimonas aerilata]
MTNEGEAAASESAGSPLPPRVVHAFDADRAHAPQHPEPPLLPPPSAPLLTPPSAPLSTPLSAEGSAPVAPARAASRGPLLLGLLALLLSLLGLVALIVGVSVAAPAAATEADWAVATGLSLAANVLTVAGVLLGVVVVIGSVTGRHRLRRALLWGVAAIVVGVLSNPWLQVAVFSLLS